MDHSKYYEYQESKQHLSELTVSDLVKIIEVVVAKVLEDNLEGDLNQDFTPVYSQLDGVTKRLNEQEKRIRGISEIIPKQLEKLEVAIDEIVRNQSRS